MFAFGVGGWTSLLLLLCESWCSVMDLVVRKMHLGIAERVGEEWCSAFGED